jgi:hypothetical protein
MGAFACGCAGWWPGMRIEEILEGVITEFAVGTATGTARGWGLEPGVRILASTGGRPAS